MENILPVLIAVITGSVLLILIMIVRSGKKKGGKTSNSARQRNRAVIIRECTKRLTHDPHNINSLQELADLYFEEQNWEKAFPLYDSLHELSLVHPEIDIQKDAIRQGMCALKVNKLDEAEKGLFAAHKLLPNDYDTNFYLGQYLFLRKEYDKAIACLHKAHTIRPDASEVNRPLGFLIISRSIIRSPCRTCGTCWTKILKIKKLFFHSRPRWKRQGSVKRRSKCSFICGPIPRSARSRAWPPE